MKTQKPVKVNIKDFSVLKNLGYYESIMAAGWISGDNSTIIIENRSPYTNHIQQYSLSDAHTKQHKENIEILRRKGYIQD